MVRVTGHRATAEPVAGGRAIKLTCSCGLAALGTTRRNAKIELGRQHRKVKPVKPGEEPS